MQKLILFALGLLSLPLVIATFNYGKSPKVNPKVNYHIVKVTMYTTDPKQTDASPYITASGFKLNRKNPKKHRIIAVSRDLKRKLKFGKKVKLTGIGEYSGIYVVEDVMNSRFKNRVDILININDKPDMFKKAKLVIL